MAGGGQRGPPAAHGDPEPPAPAAGGLLSRIRLPLLSLGALLGSGGRRTDSATQTPREPLQSEAERLALDVVYQAVGRRSGPPSDQLTATMRRAVHEILTKHHILFSGLVGRLNLSEMTAYETYRGIADEMFSVGAVSWERIVTLYAFSARLAVHCQENQMSHMVPEIARYLTQYVSQYLCTFVREQGGWEALCDHFSYQENMEDRVWRVLLKLGLGLGLAATAAFVTTGR